MIEVREGDALDLLRAMPADSVHSVVTDPPYPEIDRPYGRLSEADWADLMHAVVIELRRVLVPSGSAVLVLQPNSERVGRMRPWLWDFLSWAAREWNVVQDAYWWNHAAPPTVHCHRARGLMRPSMKLCVWLGEPDCYRNQGAVLWRESEANRAVDLEDRALRRHPSGLSMRPGRAAAASRERGGVTPFNVLPMANTNSSSSGGALGHGAATPLELCRWWIRYLTPAGGTVLDPFAGSGSVAVACLAEGAFDCVALERDASYARMALARARQYSPLFHDVRVIAAAGR
jgi:hypothetical protein